ncbi:MAG: hypothetical protein QW770_00455 [Candidatus Bathyarchaeia archaeon]
MIRVLEGFKSSLTPREQKGLNFEKLVYRNIKDFSPVYHPQSKGSDFLFHFGGQSIELEAKFSHARIYPSWIMRDWVSSILILLLIPCMNIPCIIGGWRRG